jgi:hypothetical protein
MNIKTPEYTFKKPKMFFYTTNDGRIPGGGPPGPAEKKYNKYQNTNYPRADLKQVYPKPMSIEECQKECNKTDKCTGFVTNRTDTCWLKGPDVGEAEFNSNLDYYYTGYAPIGPAYEGYYQCIKNNVRQDTWDDDGQNGALRNWKQSDADTKCNEQDYPAWANYGNVPKVGNCYGDCKAVPVSESPAGVVMIQNLGNNGCLDSGGQGPSYINNNCQKANNFRYSKSQPWRVGASIVKLVNIQNGYCLESDGRLRDCGIQDVNNNQIWVLAKDRTLRNMSDTNKCFNGSNLVECDPENKSQKWKYLANQGTKQPFDYQLFSGRSIRR